MLDLPPPSNSGKWRLFLFLDPKNQSRPPGGDEPALWGLHPKNYELISTAHGFVGAHPAISHMKLTQLMANL